MQDHIDEITALGAGALGVSVAAPYQAELLMRDQIDFELLLDPDGETIATFPGRTRDANVFLVFLRSASGKFTQAAPRGD